MGSVEETAVEQSLEPLIERVSPELIAVTGDLTHRGRRQQHERAAEFLRRLGQPLLVIPGNHDIPYTFPARFTRPWAEFERQWETVEPVHRSEGLFVVGLNSVRPWRHQSGGIRSSQIAGVAERLAEAHEGALRVVALHHHLIGAPWRSRKKPVARRSEVLAGLVDAGAELILAGHIHQAAVSERHEFEVEQNGLRGVTVSVAPGLRAASAAPPRRGAGPARLRGDPRRAPRPDLRLARRRVGPHGPTPILERPQAPGYRALLDGRAAAAVCRSAARRGRRERHR